MTLVALRAAVVGDGLDCLRDRGGSGVGERFRQPFPKVQRGQLPVKGGSASYCADTHTRVDDPTCTVGRDGSGYPDRREILAAARREPKVRLAASRLHRHRDVSEHFLRRDLRLHERHDQIVDPHLSRAGGRGELDACTRRKEHRGKILPRICVSKVSSNGRHGPHSDVGRLARGRSQAGTVPPNQLGLRDGM